MRRGVPRQFDCRADPLAQFDEFQNLALTPAISPQRREHASGARLRGAFLDHTNLHRLTLAVPDESRHFPLQMEYD
jgi:hypothetical protein